MEGLRQRRRPLDQVVQTFDAFPKFQESVQEEKKASGGIISLMSFAVMGSLIIGELWTFFDSDFKYKFPVDRDFNVKLGLDVDLVVAMPCGQVGADISDASERALSLGDDGQLRTTPTTFKLSPTERQLWDHLRDAQRAQSRPGQAFKSLDTSTWVSDSVRLGLDEEAARKEAVIAEENEAQDFNPFAELFGGKGGIRIISNQGGVLQLIELGSVGGGSSGDACRVSGHIPVSKMQRVNFEASGNLHIAPGRSIPMGGGAHAHLNLFGGPEASNFSHRIERFDFGPRVVGLVTPLAGTEKLSENSMDLYQYYLKIVPTRIYTVAASLGLQDPITTYQYSVTHRKRAIHHAQGSHGMPGLNIKWEVSSITVEVRETRQSLWSLCVRLCSVVGGVFATSQMLAGLISTLIGLCSKAPA